MARIADPLAKSKLLLAARAEFAQLGLSAARVEDIARRAGLAKGSFYLHFQNKEQAFVDIVDAFFAELERMTETCRGDLDAVRTPADAFAMFRAQDERILEFLWDNRDVVRMILEGTPKYSHILDGLLDSRAQLAAEDVRKCQRRGLYRADVDPDVVGRILTGGYYNVVRRLTQMKTKPDLASLIDTILKVFLEGLLSRRASKRSNS